MPRPAIICKPMQTQTPPPLSPMRSACAFRHSSTFSRISRMRLAPSAHSRARSLHSAMMPAPLAFRSSIRRALSVAASSLSLARSICRPTFSISPRAFVASSLALSIPPEGSAHPPYRSMPPEWARPQAKTAPKAKASAIFFAVPPSIYSPTVLLSRSRTIKCSKIA